MAWFAAQMLGGQVINLIGNYLSSPLHAPSSSAVSGQETLYDEENWARVLDAQSVLFLVRPFIQGVQTLDITAIAVTSNQPSQGPGRRLDPDLPPSYEDLLEPSEDFMTSRSYQIIRTSQRLVEVLSTASAGPSGSSPRAWGLNVTASVEICLQLLELYETTTRRMSNAPAGSFLALIHKKLNLMDEDLLQEATKRFTSVQLHSRGTHEVRQSGFYRLRLPAHHRYLTISNEWKLFESSEERGRCPGIGRQGNGLERVVFVPVKETTAIPTTTATTTTATEAATTSATTAPATTAEVIAAEEKTALHVEPLDTTVRYGMLVKVAAFPDKASQPLIAIGSSLDGDKPAIFRVVHNDERYRTQSIGRAITVRDRIILMEKNTQKLLSRITKKTDEWSVGFGTSDDTCWVVSAPM